jgi:PAS domain S-box-containing protein
VKKGRKTGETEGLVTQENQSRKIRQSIRKEAATSGGIVLAPGQGSWIGKALREDLIAILNNIPCGIAILESPFGKVRYINRQILDTLGYSLTDVPTTTALVKKAYREQGLRGYSRRVWKKMVEAGGGTDMVDALCADGTVRTFENRSVVLREDLIVVIWIDVTQRRLLETELRESEPRFSSLFEKSNEPFLLLDGNRIVTCNLAAQELFDEWDRQRLLSKTINDLLPERQRDGRLSSSKMQTLLKNVLKKGSSRFEWTVIRRDGSEIPVELSVAVVTTHEKNLFFMVARDVTRWKNAQKALVFAKHDLETRVKERTIALSTANRQLRKEIGTRKETEQELRKSREQLRLLSEHLQQIRENDMLRIAREVHDRLGQSLAALKIDLAEVKNTFGAGRNGLKGKVQQIEKQVNDTMQSVREICKDLRPPVFDDLGLMPAIRLHLRDFEKKTGISCTVATDGMEPDTKTDASLVVFRIFQEAMSNILRHANATAVTVGLTWGKQKLMLKVKDNGKGIPPDRIHDPLSFGILGMRERVRFWGGSLVIKGLPNKGTILHVSIPFKKTGNSTKRAKRPIMEQSMPKEE